MKKTVVFLMLIAVVVLIGLVPFKQQKTLNIKVQFLVVLQQLLQPEKWERWQPDVNQAWQKNPAQVKIEKQNASFSIQIPGSSINFKPVGFTFYVDKNSTLKSSSYQFLAMPVVKDGTTQLNISQKTNLWSRFLSLFGGKIENDLDELKAFLEDTRRYYGFEIRRTMVTDSNILVEKRKILLKNKALEIAQTEQDLRLYAQQQNLQIVQPVIADIRAIGQDSLRLMIGLPVNQASVSTGKIQFMHQPPHGHMLTGLYTGKYGGRQKLYLAMRTYMADHNLSSPEDPYEKYLDNKIPISDASLVHLQVNFPIF